MKHRRVSWLAAEVVARWRERSIARAPATPAQVVDVETRLDIRLPDDLATLYLAADGMRAGEMDDLLIRFWSIAELRPHEGLFVFADFSFCAHGYAIDLESGAIVLVGGPERTEVAASFADFLEDYLTHPARLFAA